MAMSHDKGKKEAGVRQESSRVHLAGELPPYENGCALDGLCTAVLTRNCVNEPKYFPRKLRHQQHRLRSSAKLQWGWGPLGSGAMVQLHGAQDSTVVALLHPHTA